MADKSKHTQTPQEVRIAISDTAAIGGSLNMLENPKGIVLFAHGSGSSRFSPRNRYVAAQLNSAGLATILIDLLTKQEEAIDLRTGRLRFDIPLLASRVTVAINWLLDNKLSGRLPIGYFGSSTGAAAALVAAAQFGDKISAVVSRGGRPDLACDQLPALSAPTLLIVGQNDPVVIEMNAGAAKHLRAENKLVIIPGATHLFEEPGTLEVVAQEAAQWFLQHLTH